MPRSSDTPLVPRRNGVIAAALVTLAMLTVGSLAGCVAPPPPAPATVTTAAPPWPAPRDAISTIDAAGLAQLPLSDTSDPHVLTITITVDGSPVTIPAHVGVDRVRAIQAPVHTHDQTGQVWLEGSGNRSVTLAQFFTVWGVAFGEGCLASACTDVVVTADGQPVADPESLVLRSAQVITVTARTS